MILYRADVNRQMQVRVKHKKKNNGLTCNIVLANKKQMVLLHITTYIQQLVSLSEPAEQRLSVFNVTF